jgi:signal transduction histidine kinase
MFSYEKTLKYRLEEVIGTPLGEVERLLFGADGVLSETLSNAFVHGHRRDTSLGIEVAVGIVENGLRLSVRDQGPGFDVESALERLESGRAYFRIAGNGMRCLLERPEVFVAWSNEGREVHLLVMGVGRGRLGT